jgi:hypothetical protein
MFLFYYNPCNVHDEREIEARRQIENELRRERDREKAQKLLPELLRKIVLEARKGMATQDTEWEIANLLSKARREDNMPKGLIDSVASELRRAFFVMKSVLVDEFVGLVLGNARGKARENMVLRILEHPFFNDMRRLERRAEIIEWHLVREGGCSKTTRELQVLSIPKCVRDEVEKAAASPEAAEAALAAMSLPRLEGIMEKHELEVRRGRLAEKLGELIKNMPDPPSNGMILRLISADVDRKAHLEIDAALVGRCGIARVADLQRNFEKIKWPDRSPPLANERWTATGEQSIKEMEGLLRHLRARQGAAAAKQSGKGKRSGGMKMRNG